jgi:hypothetical protein
MSLYVLYGIRYRCMFVTFEPQVLGSSSEVQGAKRSRVSVRPRYRETRAWTCVQLYWYCFMGSDTGPLSFKRVDDSCAYPGPRLHGLNSYDVSQI